MNQWVITMKLVSNFNMSKKKQKKTSYKSSFVI